MSGFPTTWIWLMRHTLTQRATSRGRGKCVNLQPRAVFLHTVITNPICHSWQFEGKHRTIWAIAISSGTATPGSWIFSANPAPSSLHAAALLVLHCRVPNEHMYHTYQPHYLNQNDQIYPRYQNDHSGESCNICNHNHNNRHDSYNRFVQSAWKRSKKSKSKSTTPLSANSGLLSDKSRLSFTQLLPVELFLSDSAALGVWQEPVVSRTAQSCQ